MAKQYIEPQKRYEDHKSTGILFLVLGIIGTAATLLCWMDVFRFPLSGFQLSILLAMFVAFVGFGFWSLRRASEVLKTIDTENNQIADMRKWIEEHREYRIIDIKYQTITDEGGDRTSILIVYDNFVLPPAKALKECADQL